jgi:hypothetical protein
MQPNGVDGTAVSKRVIFEESVRGLAQQEQTLDGIRGRAGTLLTAASLITAFLGGQALEVNQTVERIAGEAVTRSEITTFGWAAVGCFVGTLAVAILLLLPWRWVFTHDVHQLMDDFVVADEPERTDEELYYHLAYWNYVNSRGNARRLDWMLALFTMGCILLAAEAILWLLVLV